MEKFYFADLILPDESKINEIKNIEGYVAYRIHKIGTDKNYSGHTKNLYWRLYNNIYGHISSKDRPDDECDYIHICMKSDGFENFELIIEGLFDNLLDVKSKEAEIAERYECFTKGYNRTQNGNGGSAIGSKVIYNPYTNECRYVSPLESIIPYLEDGWINTNKTKGTITLENSKGDIVMVTPGSERHLECIELGYTRLSWVGSIWLKNAITNQYHHIRSTSLAEIMLSTGDYIKEAPTKNRINVYDLVNSRFRKITEEEFYMNQDKYIKRSSYEGSIMMINPSTNEVRKINKIHINEFKNLGWIKYKKTGKVTLFNPFTGDQTCTYDQLKITNLLSEGWKRGKCNHNGVTFMNNGDLEIKLLFKDNDTKLSYLSKGYKYGKLTND